MKTVELVYHNHGIIAVNKPVGMDVNGIPSRGYPRLVDVVGKHLPLARLVNRIDRDTSGIVLFSESREVGGKLSGLYGRTNEAARRKKTYAALVSPEPQLDEFEVDIPLKTGAKRATLGPATTGFKVLERRGDCALMEAVLLKHGRTHQIRKHALSQGCPIVGDPWYKGAPADRMMLHAWKSWMDLFGGVLMEAGCPDMGLSAPPPLDVWQVEPLTQKQLDAYTTGPKPKPGARRPDGMHWDEWQRVMPRVPRVKDLESKEQIMYDRNSFQEVRGVPGKFYCPGCNASPEDHMLSSIGCPCSSHGTGHGSLTTAGIESYLAGVHPCKQGDTTDCCRQC